MQVVDIWYSFLSRALQHMAAHSAQAGAASGDRSDADASNASGVMEGERSIMDAVAAASGLPESLRRVVDLLAV